MPTNKPRINFYADEDVWDYWESLPVGIRTKRINQFVREGIDREDDDREELETMRERVARLEKTVRELSKIVKRKK